MNLEILQNPKYCILEDGEDYVFYNPARHYACRLTPLDLSIFNLIFKYKHIDEILTQIPSSYHTYIINIYNLVEKYKVLDTDPVVDPQLISYCIPNTYYIHLTYTCNLNCSYCYNKSVRKSLKELTVKQWEQILDKILPYAKKIVLTGGEPFLYKKLSQIITYIKKVNTEIIIELISNCMVDFETYENIERIFDNIDAVVFSCDNMSDVNQPRKNFNVDKFKKNISYVKSNHPNLHITISSVYSNGSRNEQCLICDYCKHMDVSFRSVLVVPGTPDETSLLPPLEEYNSSLKRGNQEIPNLRMHCGAGIGILSVNPQGDLFPCQSLMSSEYWIGNLNENSIEELMEEEIVASIRESFCVENIPICRNCNLRYLCAAGCRAATLNTEGSPSAYPEKLCKYYKAKQYNILRSIPKFSEINQIILE
ncbi:PqqA peptide cyclase [Bacteroides pyogenes]|nr:PqqA peptide cyclase [Bacteroides pyogenes]MBR8809097.1 PqqA peptide cyclase [Bacteroides pyogenes]